jgi:thiamine-phosphate pyrophosphorylase
MTLGPLVVVTDRRRAEAAGRTLVDTVDAALDGGARSVLLREKDLPSGDRVALAEQLATRLRSVDGGRLLVAGDAGLARAMHAVGVHLAATDPWPPITSVGNRQLLVGRSCHTVDELRAAADEGAAYATLSPVWATPSKPGYGPPLGPDGLRAAVDALPDLPIYALGGVTADRVPQAIGSGAAGVAVMGGIMGADHPAKAVAALLHALTP